MASSSGSSSSDGMDTDARLLITKMVLENFKSYGGVREVGPFHKRFSSIVGPNGSGKSNVIDAMLFVFGKKAKKLRLNKVSELIHKSDTYPDLEYCRVSVHFCDIIDTPNHDDDYEVVPNTDLVVTRIAYKNNSSKYLVDGKTSTFTEVGQLLRRRGIDLDNNRFLILQGEVEQIAMMPPKGQGAHDEGLLEFLEDIIGSNRHVEKIEEIGKELEGLNEVRGEKLGRLKVTETERENLESAKAEAEAYLKKERQIRRKRNILCQKHIIDANVAIDSVKEKRGDLKKRQEYETQKLADKQKDFKELDAQLKAKAKEHEAIVKEMTKTKEQFTAFERKDIEHRESLKHNKSTIKKLGTTIKKEEGKVKDLTAKAQDLEESLPSLKARIEAANAEKDTVEQKLEAMLEVVKGETEALRSELEAKQEEAAPVKKQVAELEAALSTTATEVELVKQKATQAQQELAQIVADEGKMGADVEAKAKELDESAGEIRKLEDREVAVKAEIEALEVREGELAGQMKEAVAAAEEAKVALAGQSGKTRGVVAHLMAAAKKGKPLQNAGLVGRLGDLGAIDQKYDVAISTACGMLDYVVVKTAAGGQKCIEYLKKHNLGRTSFIVLDQIRDRSLQQMNKPFQVPAQAERLVDLVRPADEGLRCAFFFALRNTLVTKDLDTAMGFAYQGNRTLYRVVALDGKMIDSNGTMSGGGKVARRGGMSSVVAAAAGADEVTSEEVAALDARAAQLSAALDACRKELAQLRREAKDIQARVRKIVKSQPQLAMTVESLKASLVELVARKAAVEPLTHLSAEEEERVAELEAEIAGARRNAKATTTKYDKLQRAIDALQKKILEAGGAPVQKQRAKLDACAAKVDEAETAVATAEVDMKEARRAVQKAQKAAEKATAEREALQQKQEEIQEEMKRLEVDAIEVQEAYEAATKNAQAKEKEVDAINEDIGDIQKEIARIKTVDVDIANQLEEYSANIKENESKLKYWKKELSEVHATHKKDFQEWGDLAEVEGEAGAGAEPLEGETEAEAEAEGGDDAVAAKESSGDQGALPDLSAEQLEMYDKEEIKYEIAMLESEREGLLASVNMGAIAEYRTKEKEYQARFDELEVATRDRDESRNAYEDLRRQRLEEFMEGFGQITLKLKEMYQMITLGGDAELELVDSLDPFSEGIVFSVRPPKKSWKNIANLSGGEKTLSSLALVFALHHYKPTPLYVMDEIDAALDFKNVSIVANYIKERTKNAQFVIISLRNNMFELADRLVGIYKTENVTKSVTINPKLLAPPPQAEQRSTGALVDRTNTQQLATAN